MKKMLFGLMLLGATSAMAQNQETTEIAPVDKYSVATNRFWAKNPFKSFRRSWNGDITVGKWFTPVIGVRAKAQMMQLQCVDGRENPSFDMLNVNMQGMINLRNLFVGYQPGRVWNISLYAGTGFYRNFDANQYAFMYTGGILNTFNVTKRLFINLDIYSNTALNELDNGAGYKGGGNFFTSKDRQFGVSLGLGVNLGKVGWSKTPDLEAINAMHKAQTDALNASLAEQQSENDKLKGLLAKRPETSTSTVTKEVAVTTPVSVFFNLNSSRIASKKDLVNVQALVDQLNGGKVEVYGYADSKTGSADYNKQLSERRAEAVAKELKKMGLKDEQIIIKPMGGVNELTPASYNRRVIVKVVK